MHYEIQTLVLCPTRADCHATLLEAAKDLEVKLKAAGLGFVVEVRDIRQGQRLFRSIDAGYLSESEV